MKRLLTFLSAILISSAGFAQPIICSGNPLTGINGNTYDSVASTGTSMFGSVANSKDGKLFATNNGKLRYISTANFAVTDSMDININYFVGRESNDTMFGLKANGTLCRFNTATKTVDSLPIAGSSHSRVTERPMAKEVWISGNPLQVVSYTGNLIATNTFSIGTNILNVKLSSDGTKAYANSGFAKRIYIIDAVNKILLDSISFAGAGPANFELNEDDSKLFVTTGNILVYQTSNNTLIDSIITTRPVMTLNRHPSKHEIWCVNHFDDTVSVFNSDTHAWIDSIPVGGSPFFLAFGQLGMGVREIAGNNNTVKIYPNPATNAITVEMADGIAELYDLKGSILKAQKVNIGKAVINIETLPAGLYYLKATDTHGAIKTAKFSKN